MCYSFWLLISISLTFLIGFARFYVGVHTINQILYGFSWGFWLAFFFHFVLREKIMLHVNQLTIRSMNYEP